MLEILRVFGMVLNAFAIVVLGATLVAIFGAIVSLLWEWWSTKTGSAGQNQHPHTT